MSPDSLIPDIPGQLVPNDRAQQLKDLVRQMCQLDNPRFPGGQPVSFSKSDLTRLEREDYWVCEKSDGVRVLVLIVTFPDGQEVYLIDRKNNYREIENLYFPHHEDPKRRALGHSLLDGELVWDVDPQNGKKTMRLLAFDCLVVDGQNVMGKHLDKRYGRLKAHAIDPYRNMIKELPHMAEHVPFDLQIKTMQCSYAVDKVIHEDLPRLQHGSDGLIYTCAETSYVAGTDSSTLKWKPPSENSIDFKLELRFPPSSSSSSSSRNAEPDFFAKPSFILHAWQGGSNYAYFDIMDVSDDKWEEMKATGEQYDDRVIEVAWDVSAQNWVFMRFRDDKEHGNHISVIENILASIEDGVERDELVARVSVVRTAWKNRAADRERQKRQAQPQHSNQPQSRPPPNHGHPQSQPPPQNRNGYTGPPRMTKVTGPLVVDGMVR